jgi:hypothetical protein
LQEHSVNLTEKYERLSTDYEELRRMIMDMRSHMGLRVRSFFGRLVLGTTNLLLLLQCRHCSSLILFEHINL